MIDRDIPLDRITVPAGRRPTPASTRRPGASPSEAAMQLPVLDPADPCRDCGACCRHMVRPPFLGPDDPDWDRLNRERPDLVAGIEFDRRMRRANKDDGDDYPCLWLDRETGRCRHYQYRPEVCRDFEPGDEDCLAARRRFGLDA
jgi:hypothetical protein